MTFFHSNLVGDDTNIIHYELDQSQASLTGTNQ